MADTGAPWNLPYPLSSDLVKDGALAIQDLAEDVAGYLVRGLGTNVVQTVKTNTFTTTSTSFTDLTGISVAITPTFNTSKVLVLVQLQLGTNPAASAIHGKLVRGSTDVYIGDAASSRTQASFEWIASSNNYQGSVSLVYLDSPATTSSTTYKVQLRTNAAGTITVNRSSADTNAATESRTASSITAIEVKA